MPEPVTPITRFEVSTRDPARGVELIRQMYADGRIQISGAAEDFLYAVRSATADDLTIDRARHTTRAVDHSSPMPGLTFLLPVRGYVHSTFGREEVRVGAGEVALYPYGRSFVSRWDDLEVFLVRLPLAAVARVAAERTGVDPADFRFESTAAITPALGSYFRETTTYLYRSLHAPDSALANPLVRAAAVDTALTAALAVFPSTATTAAYLPSPPRVPPSLVRRALAHIEAHADRPFTVTDVADEVGVSARGLQAAFRRHLDTTPGAYARTVRLHRAHRDLQAADPTEGDTVAAIARRWGFAHSGRFAVTYRQAFGHSPSHTLHT